MNSAILYEIILLVIIQHVLIILGEKPRTNNPCPNNFLRIHNKCYYFSHDYDSWERAKWKCQERNSTLAVVTNRNQNNALREFLKKGYVAHISRWMGGQYDWKSSQWKWIYNGKVIPPHQFDNDLSNKNLAWHCLVIDPNNHYRWNASSCFSENYYICQTRLINRKPQAANLTSNSGQNNENNGGLNSTEQHDTQPGYYIVDADTNPTQKKKPRMRFTCPDKNYVLVAKRCYFLSRTKENWNNAYYKCQDMKSELTIFNSTKQAEKVRTKLRIRQLTNEKRWIGGYFDFKNSVWKWAASGRVLPVQPNAASDLKWSCVVWDPERSSGWFSESCLTPLYYMCQSKATPVERKLQPRRRLRKPTPS
ncbi:C-type lectin [Oryctes borbonicus]|uniref:C-type lectin n=1 Tax=Oryctes borbonicus TaxID=1629725 RepID=A0A0T6B6M0_9SCAR|nr:C-type lectin [Oryctes borbonicus]